MTFSVLMAVYKNDNPQHLNEALISIYESQTRKPDEIIVVFDGPLTDDLYTVLNSFRAGKEHFVHYLPQEKNSGLGNALRIGSLLCSCDYILRMDADDISDERRFEKQIEFCLNHPEVDVLGTDISEFNFSLDEDMRIRRCPNRHTDIMNMAKTRNPMNHVTICMKKKALIDSGGYENLLLLEDYYLWIRMLSAGYRFANLNQSLVYVRIGNGFNEKRGSKLRIDGWKILQQYMIKCKMITRCKALVNMICIYIFTYCPNWLRKGIYDIVLRK